MTRTNPLCTGVCAAIKGAVFGPFWSGKGFEHCLRNLRKELAGHKRFP